MNFTKARPNAILVLKYVRMTFYVCEYRISLSGPLWTAATRVASYRVLAILGGFVSSLGVLCMSFATSGAHLALAMSLISMNTALRILFLHYFHDVA